jgi:phage-related protein
MNQHAFLVIYDPDAVLDFEVVKSREERKATYTAIDKLRRLGPRLPSPHMKALKGEPGLLELRPRQGRSQVRPIYGRIGDSEFVILAFATRADKADFDAAVAAARDRRGRYAR